MTRDPPKSSAGQVDAAVTCVRPGVGANPPTIDRVAIPWLTGMARAPDFPDGLDRLNVARPPQIADLRGRLAILDFWTFY